MVNSAPKFHPGKFDVGKLSNGNLKIRHWNFGFVSARNLPIRIFRNWIFDAQFSHNYFFAILSDHSTFYSFLILFRAISSKTPWLEAYFGAFIQVRLYLPDRWMAKWATLNGIKENSPELAFLWNLGSIFRCTVLALFISSFDFFVFLTLCIFWIKFG